ncbi:MAG: sulfatase-like hydrolase/transferase [Coxiellaceae bacterium]|nr:sulfatase-like hydrolase/transferase [Coxiellaceae bacterium]
MARSKHRFLLWALVALSLFAVIVQAYIYITGGISGSGSTLALSFLSKSILFGQLSFPALVWRHLLGFCSAIVFLYTAYTLLIYWLTILSGDQLRIQQKYYLHLGMFIWLLGSLVVLLINQITFAGSVYTFFLDKILSNKLSIILLVFFSAILTGFIVLALWRLVRNCIQFTQNKKWLRGVAAAMVAVFSFSIFHSVTANKHYHGATAEKPNVIIVGVDALRPDYVTADNMPFISDYLKNGVDFTGSYTMLPRTFASYTGILTGLYPKQSGVYFDFQSKRNLNLNGSIASILKKKNYTTYYSTDDAQYTNINHQYGFEKITKNNPSVLNCILSKIDDFPLFNIFANTSIGRWLFPYTYNNRGAENTYQPRRYVDQVLHSEATLPQQPAFLVVHFCLPHTPYAWAKKPFVVSDTTAQNYLAAVKRVDTQLKTYLSGLKKMGFLRHAVVIVLSDHGEALYQSNDRVVSIPGYRAGPSSRPDIIKQLSFLHDIGPKQFSYAFGHGNDVLSLTQMHNVLAWRLYGFSRTPTQHTVTQRVSVLDIKPTVLQLLHIPYNNSEQSFSLMPSFYGKHIAKHSYMFFETGYNPDALYSPPYSAEKLVKQVTKVLTLNPANGTIEIRADAFPRVIRSKQSAVWYKNWYLAIIPKHNKPAIYVLVNLKTKQWTDDLHSSLAKHAPVTVMIKQLNIIS